jgi:hypothetical protein
MPGLPDAAEKEAMKTKMNSYGKTWHTWMTGMHNREADVLPFGPPQLQWSFNRDGEAMPSMIADRDHRFGFITADARRDRKDLAEIARPQAGVDSGSPAWSPAAKPQGQ